MEDVSPPRIDPINFPDKGADYMKVPFFLLSLLSINSEVFFFIYVVIHFSGSNAWI